MLLVTRGGGIVSVLPRGIAAAVNISLTFVSSETYYNHAFAVSGLGCCGFVA